MNDLAVVLPTIISKTPPSYRGQASPPRFGLWPGQLGCREGSRTSSAGPQSASRLAEHELPAPRKQRCKGGVAWSNSDAQSCERH